MSCALIEEHKFILYLTTPLKHVAVTIVIVTRCTRLGHHVWYLIRWCIPGEGRSETWRGKRSVEWKQVFLSVVLPSPHLWLEAKSTQCNFLCEIHNFLSIYVYYIRVSELSVPFLYLSVCLYLFFFFNTFTLSFWTVS